MTHDSHASFRSYLFGFLLSIALTAAAFFVADAWGASAIIPIVFLALVQLLVQLVFFLHLGRDPKERSKSGLFGLTFIIITILVGGTLWIMQNLSHLHVHSETPTDLYEGGVVAPQNELR